MECHRRGLALVSLLIDGPGRRRPLAHANARGDSRAIAAIARQIFKKRAKWARRKSAFDYKAINGAMGFGAGRIPAGIAYFMSAALTNRAAHKKRSICLLSNHRRLIAIAQSCRSSS